MWIYRALELEHFLHFTKIVDSTFLYNFTFRALGVEMTTNDNDGFKVVASSLKTRLLMINAMK
jgi:hypothetical protein